jgi:hypothetical protein
MEHRMEDPNYTAAELERLEVVRPYFIRADAGRADTVELFTNDIQIYFPKFGIAKGKMGFAELAEGLANSMSALAHDLSSFTYVVRGERVVVEGLTQGSDRHGHAWHGGETPGGRFCSVFEFRGARIARMHIYPDPDYTGLDEDRFLWGRDRTW